MPCGLLSWLKWPNCAGRSNEGRFMSVEEKRVDIEKPEGHHCFACGTANPIGLNLKFYSLGDAVCSDITGKVS